MLLRRGRNAFRAQFDRPDLYPPLDGVVCGRKRMQQMHAQLYYHNAWLTQSIHYPRGREHPHAQHTLLVVQQGLGLLFLGGPIAKAVSFTHLFLPRWDNQPSTA
jgi:hypothetical protein